MSMYCVAFGLPMSLRARTIKIRANIRATVQPAKKPKVFTKTKFKGKKLISKLVPIHCYEV